MVEPRNCILSLLVFVSYAHAMDNSQEREWSSQELRYRVIAEQRALQAREYIHYCLDKNPKKPELAVIQRGQDEYAKHVAFYDANTLQYIARLHLVSQELSPTCVAYSPDGQHLAIGNNAGYVQIVRCVRNRIQEVGAYQLPDAKTIKNVIWSPNSELLVIVIESRHLLSPATHMLTLSSGRRESISFIAEKRLQFHPTQAECLITLSKYTTERKYTTGDTDRPLKLARLKRNEQYKKKLNSDFQPSHPKVNAFCISTDGTCCAYVRKGTITYSWSRKIELHGWIEFQRRASELSDGYVRVERNIGEVHDTSVPKLRYADDMKQFVCGYGKNIASYTHDGQWTGFLHQYAKGWVEDLAIVASTPECIKLALILKEPGGTQTWLEKAELIISKDQAAKASKNKLEKVKEFVCLRGWVQLKKKMGGS